MMMTIMTKIKNSRLSSTGKAAIFNDLEEALGVAIGINIHMYS